MIIHIYIYVNNIVRFVYKRYFEIGKVKEEEKHHKVIPSESRT